MSIAMVIMPSTVVAQKYFSGRNEWGFGLGMSNYYGDFSKGLNTKHFKPSGCVYQKYNFSSYFGLRNQVSFLQIQGTSDDVVGLQFQNINFQTQVIEAASMVEFNFHPFGTNINDGIATPYFLLGLGGFWFDPHRLDKEEVNLRDLKTEQQASRYSQIQPSIPIGFGVKTMASNRQHAGGWIVGAEVIFRKTFTDYLDDTYKSYGDYKTIKEQQGVGAADWAQSQVLTGGAVVDKGTMRGDTHLKDWYYFAGLTFSYRFTPQVCR
ncbi:MAG: hypothetical protein RLZZ512_577 [Bacteroidota bacterium]